MNVIFLRIIGMSFTSVFLMVPIILLRAILKRAPKALICGLWALVAFRLICPYTLETPFSLLPHTYNENTIEAWMDEKVTDSSEDPDMPLLSEREEEDILLSATDSQGAASQEATGEETLSARKPFSLKLSSDQWISLLTKIWILGVVFMLVMSAVSFYRIYQKTRVSFCVEENVWICDYVQTPFILGLIHPKIYVPSDLNEMHYHSVLSHERAHLLRHDHWWKHIGYVILSLHWFNPLVWLSYILLSRDIELACDEKVVRNMSVSDKKAYSEALFSLSLTRPFIGTLHPLAFGEVGVKERIRTILTHKKPATWAAVFALIGSTVLTACFMTNPAPETVQSDLSQLVGISYEDSSGEYETAATEIPLEDGWNHFLLLGLDGTADTYEGKRNDANLILSIQADTKQVIFSSIPRDTLVYIPERGYEKLAHCYAYGGIDLVIKTVEENFDIPITGYITVNFQAMEEIVDQLGGLTLTITDAEAAHMGEYFGAWGLTGGTQLLSGYEVLQYCRIRKIDSDYQRNDRQFTVLQAIYEKVKGLSAVEYGELITTVYPSVSSNLSVKEAIYLAGILLEDLKDSPLTNQKLVDADNSVTGVYNGSSCVYMDNLEEVVTSWHKEALGESDYTPGSRIQELSDQFTALTASAKSQE